jgi:hypothetical protein
MDILPDSRLTQAKQVQRGEHRTPGHKLMLNWVPIFCANCGAPGGAVPEETCTFAFYLCVPCGETWAPLAGTYLEPDVVFWQKVHEAQFEKYGRILTPEETVEALKHEQHLLSKLAKDRP